MSNGRRKATRRKIDAWEVYDSLPAAVRAALQEGPQEWDAVWAKRELSRYVRRYGPLTAIQKTVERIYKGHDWEITTARPWQVSRLKKNRMPSPHMQAQASMQLSGRPN